MRMNQAIERGSSGCAIFAALVVALVGCIGCGPEPLSAEGEGASSFGEPLRNRDWSSNGWSLATQQSGTSTVTLQVLGPPSACETRFQVSGGTSFVQRNAADRIDVSSASRSAFNPWTTLGNKTFSSRPACVTLDAPYDAGVPLTYQLAVVGRSGFGNAFWIAIWQLGQNNPYNVPPNAPSQVYDWAQVSSTDSFASAPALTAFAGNVLVVGRKSNNKLYVRSHGVVAGSSDPWGGGSWGSTYELPALPTGWTATGDPTICSAPSGLGYLPTIATRATNGGSTGYFKLSTEGTLFTAWSSISLPTGVTPASDLSMEIGKDRTRITGYFRATTGRIYQASATIGQSFAPFAVMFSNSDTFTDGPAATGGELFVDPAHMVFAKKTNESNDIRFAQSGQGIE